MTLFCGDFPTPISFDGVAYLRRACNHKTW